MNIEVEKRKGVLMVKASTIGVELAHGDEGSPGRIVFSFDIDQAMRLSAQLLGAIEAAMLMGAVGEVP